jgi:hypothetical protein
MSIMTPREIQTALKNAGFYAGAIDGDLGHETRRAISKFRRSQRLGSGSNPGPVTQGRLKRFLPAKAVPVVAPAPTSVPAPKPVPKVPPKAGSIQERMAMLMRALQHDFGLDVTSAAAIAGNVGHESGFNPRAKGPGGDFGLCQWVGPRRRALFAFAKRHNIDPLAFRTQYEYMRHELKGSEAAGIRVVKRPGTLMSKVQRFERAFERAGVKHYASRYNWALKALRAV